jgi:hypothetical protein
VGAFTFGVGPAGAHDRSLDEAGRETPRRTCRELLGDPDGPFTLDSRVGVERGVV